jgi:hypothetical protein
MDMYVKMYDDMKRIDGDNPTIGIILCEENGKAPPFDNLFCLQIPRRHTKIVRMIVE